MGKVKLPYDGRNISVRVCKAAFRQKLGSIAVREFRPVICNCRAAHYNSPFLASELSPLPPPSSCQPSRLSRFCNRGSWRLCSRSRSFCLFPLVSLVARARAYTTHFTLAFRRERGKGLIKTFIFNYDFNCFPFARRTLPILVAFPPLSRYRNNISLNPNLDRDEFKTAYVIRTMNINLPPENEARARKIQLSVND